MADNTPITDASLQVESIATDELSTQNGVDVSGQNPRIKAQRVKPGYGSDGDFTDVDATHGLPVNVIDSLTVATTPAAARTTDSIAAAPATDALMNGLTVLAPKFAPIIASSSGATTVISLVAAKKLRILAYTVVCTSAVTVKWQSHTTTAQATGAMPFGANGGTSAPYCQLGHFETVAGEALDINLGGAVVVGGHMTYVEV